MFSAKTVTSSSLVIHAPIKTLDLLVGTYGYAVVSTFTFLAGALQNRLQLPNQRLLPGSRCSRGVN